MIGHLEGTVLTKDLGRSIISVGGIGLVVHTTLDTAGSFAVGATASLWTHLVVRDDALILYGFLDAEECAFFVQLIGVSGIGPKSALGILSVAPVTTLKNAIAAGDTSSLTKVSGIGHKSAQKIVLELRDKMGGARGDSTLSDDADALDALHALGYTHKEARDALRAVSADTRGVAERVKSALTHLKRL